MKSNESKPGKRTNISIFKGCKVPKLLTYSNLVQNNEKKIDIGTVHEIDLDYLECLETENPVNGAYRDYTFQCNFIVLRIVKENLKTRPNSGSMKHKGLELNCSIYLLEKIPTVFVISL